MRRLNNPHDISLKTGFNRRRNESEEHLSQKALFEWARHNRRKRPELEAMYAIPNAGKRGRRYDPRRQRWYSVEGRRLKAEGMKAGVPDICLPVPRGPFGSLYIEFKSKNGRTSDNQRGVHEILRRMGNRVEVCRDWESAARLIENYLDCRE